MIQMPRLAAALGAGGGFFLAALLVGIDLFPALWLSLASSRLSKAWQTRG
jgi:hypothetical protein